MAQWIRYVSPKQDLLGSNSAVTEPKDLKLYRVIQERSLHAKYVAAPNVETLSIVGPLDLVCISLPEMSYCTEFISTVYQARIHDFHLGVNGLNSNFECL